MAQSVQKVTVAQQNQASAQQQIAQLVKQSTINWRNEAGSIDENIRQNEKYRAELKQVQGELREKSKATTDVYGNIRKVSSETVELRKRETELKQAISENNRTINAQVKEYQSAEGSMDEMNHTLGQMRNLFRQLSDEQRNSDFGKNLQAQIKVLDKELKELDASIGNHQRKVGDYAGGFREAFSEIRGGWDDLLSGNIQGALESWTKGIDSVTESILALIPAKVAEATANTASTTATAAAVVASEANTVANIAEAGSINAVTVAATGEATAMTASATATTGAAAASNSAAAGGMKNLLTSLRALTSAAWSFIATPIGAAIIALAGIGLVAKEVWDYNEGLQESLTLTKQFTGLTGESADSVRQQAQALSDTYGNDFRENLSAAQKLVQVFKISYEEAFAELDRDLATGGAVNDEFFQSLDEYPVFFEKAGYSARQFLDTINTGFDLSLYQDKLPDSIKEFQIALNEQTKSTRDGLVNAFGASFTDDILKRVRIGATTSKDALEEIAQKAKESNLTLQQEGQLTADLLGKSMGEDLGGAEKVFEGIRHAIERANRPLSETEQYYLNLSEANRELQEAMDDALKSDSLISFQKQWDIAWIKIKTGFFEIVSVVRNLYDWYDRISGRSESLGRIWDSLQKIGKTFSNLIDFISTTFKRLSQQLGLSEDQTTSFTKTITYLTDPIKILDLLLRGIVEWIDFWASGVANAIVYTEAFARTLDQLTSLDFDKLKGLGSNAEDIRKENEELQKQNELRKNQMEGLENIRNLNNDIAEAIKNGYERKLIDDEKERIKAEEEAAKQREKDLKKQEQLQKKYAAEQKRAAEESRRAKEKAFQEELAKNEALLEHYKLTNDQKLKFDESFTLGAVLKQKQYLDKLYQMELENAEKRAKITVADALAIDVEKRTSDQQKLINYSIQLEQDKAEKIKEIDNGVADWKKKTAEGDLEISKKNLQLDLLYKIANGEDKKKAEREYQDAVYKLMVENFEKSTGLNEAEVIAKYEQKGILTELEQEYLDLIFEKKKENSEREDELRKENFEKEFENKEELLELASNAIGYESEMMEVFNAYKAMLYAKDFETSSDYEIRKLQLYASVAGAAADIAGKQTTFGKSLAAAQVAINTAVAISRAYNEWNYIPATAFALAIGTMAAMQINKIFSAQVPQAPSFSASFETGVTNSQFEGAALVDEAGPEIHVDKHGNIKSMGKNKPNIRQVKKGDTIFPAPISAKLKDVMDYNPMPDLMMSLELNNLTGNKDYDFERLEKKFDKLERAIKTKENVTFVDAGDYLIEATKSNGSTHQRLIQKAGINIRPRQTGLN